MNSICIMNALSLIDDDLIDEANPFGGNGATKENKAVLKSAQSRILCIAAAIALTMIFVGWSYGGKLINFANGGRIVIALTDGGAAANWEVSSTELDGKITQWKDHCLYLIVNGENIDITNEMSVETPYVYKFTDEEGVFHAIGIGGEAKAESYGWIEYLLDGDDPDNAAVISTKGSKYPMEPEAWETEFYRMFHCEP